MYKNVFTKEQNGHENKCLFFSVLLSAERRVCRVERAENQATVSSSGGFLKTQHWTPRQIWSFKWWDCKQMMLLLWRLTNCKIAILACLIITNYILYTNLASFPVNTILMSVLAVHTETGKSWFKYCSIWIWIWIWIYALLSLAK